MSFNNYSSLKSEVSDYLARDDLTSKIPSFITLAEAKFNRSLRCVQMEKRATALVNLGSSEPEFISLPGDFQSMRRIRLANVQGKPQLGYMGGVQMDDYRLSVGDVAGRPRHFTIFGDEIEIAPTPDAAYTIEMVYRAMIPALSEATASNWLLDLAPDAYLYGALLEASPYIKEDARIQTWAGGLTSALDGLNSLSIDMTNNAGPLTISATGPRP